MPHNIISSIPLTDQTNPNKFPAYQFQEYPKMMLKKVTKEDIAAWEDVNKRVDEGTNRVSYPMGRPRLGSTAPILNVDGQPAMVNDPEEEEAFLAEHPEAVQIEQATDTSALMDRLAKLEAENAALRAKDTDAGEKGNDDPSPKSVASLTKPPAAPAKKPAPSNKSKGKAGGLPARL